jgi:hypothetical protein
LQAVSPDELNGSVLDWGGGGHGDRDCAFQYECKPVDDGFQGLQTTRR